MHILRLQVHFRLKDTLLFESSVITIALLNLANLEDITSFLKITIFAESTKNQIPIFDQVFSTLQFTLQLFQVQHMMPSNFTVSNGGNSSFSGLQSANMGSSMQTSTSKQSYTSYKVQSNSYTTGGERVDYEDHSGGGTTERPGSRLKANIDELDTLLSDLNNAQRQSGGASQHQSRHDTFVSSSEDYGDQSTMQGRVKTTVSSLNEYTMSGSDYNRKPPSPSPKRRTPQPSGVPVMGSPAMPPRRSSPSPSGRRASPPTTHGLSAMSSANYRLVYIQTIIRLATPF